MAEVSQIRVRGTLYDIKDTVARRGSGSSPAVASTAAGMTDTSKIYVYTGSETGYTAGNWYYYDGTSWVSGGIYQSSGIETDTTLAVSGAAADSKATGDAINNIVYVGSEVQDSHTQMLVSPTTSELEIVTKTEFDTELSELKSQISSKTGLSDAIKNALKLLADTVAYENTEVGITTRNAVYSALDAVNVVSLSATYEQSDSIYTHNELDDLRQYLTVTATYDNGMSSQISTYTLVGELTAGTPVITVEYEGETATFTPTVYESVPSTYQIYDFIKSTKQSGAVNTNYWILLKQFDDLNALNFRFKLKPTNDSSTSTIFGARVDSLANSVAVYLNATTDGSRQLVIAAEDWQSTGIFLPLNEVATVVCENPSVSPSRVKVNNGEWVELPWASTVTEKQVLNLAPMLFNNPLNSSTSLKIFPNQELGHLEFFNYSGTRVGDYFPVKRVSDNVVGMYDVVENVFYTTKTAAYATIGNSSCIYAVGNWG